MGLLDMISSVVRNATPGAIALRTGYLEGQRQKGLDAQNAADKEAERRLKLAQAASLDEGTWSKPFAGVDESGTPVLLQQNKRGELRRATLGDSSSDSVVSGVTPPAMTATTSELPAFDAKPTARGFQRALQGGSIAEDPTAPSNGAGLLASMKQDLGAPQQPTTTTGSARTGRLTPYSASANDLRPTPLTVDGKPIMGFADKRGNFYDSRRQPVTGVVTPFSASEDGKAARDFTVDGVPVSGFVDKKGKHYDADGNEIHGRKITPAPAFTFSPSGVDATGRPVFTRGNTKTGELETTGVGARASAGSDPNGPLAQMRNEKYLSTVATNAIAAADQQIDPSVTGEARARQREQLAIQVILGNPKTADIFNTGMSSRHIQAANQAFGSGSDKQKQGQAKTTYQLGGDASYKPTPSNTPTRTPAPSAAAAHETGNIDLRDEGSLSDADLWEKKVAEGMPKDKATAYVRARSKKTGTP